MLNDGVQPNPLIILFFLFQYQDHPDFFPGLDGIKRACPIDSARLFPKSKSNSWDLGCAYPLIRLLSRTVFMERRVSGHTQAWSRGAGLHVWALGCTFGCWGRGMGRCAHGRFFYIDGELNNSFISGLANTDVWAQYLFRRMIQISLHIMIWVHYILWSSSRWKKFSGRNNSYIYVEFQNLIRTSGLHLAALHNAGGCAMLGSCTYSFPGDTDKYREIPSFSKTKTLLTNEMLENSFFSWHEPDFDLTYNAGILL